MIRMIAAVSINGVIGVDGGIPWMGKYPDDMKFFRTMTKDSIVVMGRKTFESMGSRPLPKRINRMICHAPSMPYSTWSGLLERHDSMRDAISAPNLDNKDIWLIGGSGIYSEGLEYTDEIYLTLIPERVEAERWAAVRFPFIHPLEWQCEPRMMGELVPAASEQKLVVAVYKRSKTNWKD